MRGRGFAGGGTRNAGGGGMSTGMPRLPKLPGMRSAGSIPKSPSMAGLGGMHKGEAYLDRAGIGAVEMAQGHKKL